VGSRIFWDVDTQVDFIRPDGALPVPGAAEIVPQLARLTAHAHARGIRIVASADDHVAGHAELADTPDFRTTFPPHCLRGTPGQAKLPETALEAPLILDPDLALEPGALIDRVRAHRGDVLLLKHHFDVFTNPHAAVVLEALDPEQVALYGVALDVCNRYAVEGLLARRPDLRLAVVTDASRAIEGPRARALLADWKARGVALVTTDEVLAEP
jgi:nicotinamidase/pyrazinamidase